MGKPSQPSRRQTPYHGNSPDPRHYKFLRESGLERWELNNDDRGLLPSIGEVCLWVTIAAVLFAFLFWALGQGV